MEREEKCREREGRKQEFTGGIKLKSRVLVGKRGGNCSTPSLTWRLGFVQVDGSVKEDLIFPTATTTTTLSARKLGANLWEVLPHRRKAVKMTNGGARAPYRRHCRHSHKDKGFEPPDDSPREEPASAGSLGRNVAAPLSLHHQPVERNGHDLQPISPASCSSSMEVAPYTHTVTPTSSLAFRGRIGEHSSFSLKMSRELFKVLLNQNWSLEAQHASNMSLVDALKRELDHCRAEIKELAREKQTNHRAMTDLMNRFAEDKIARKKRDRELIKSAVQSLRDELEDEKKLRKNSESLHRKLSRELSDTKTSFSNALKELKREKNARILMEVLCGEFATGIRDYEQNVRSLKPKPEKDRTCKESPDWLILHLSEAWLDERTQMDLSEKNTIVDRLSLEIETFLQAKNCVGSVNSIFHRRSLESFRLNGALSGPHNADDSNCGKQSNGISKQNALVGTEIHLMGKIKPNRTKKKVGSRETIKGQTREAENKHVGNLGLNSNHVLNNSIRNHSSLLGGGKLRSEYNSKEESRASPVQPWISRIKMPDNEASVTSCKWPHGLKVDTLKEKLLEARLEDQRSHSKASKGCS